MEEWIWLPSWRQLLFILAWIVGWHLLIFLIARKLPYSAYHVPNWDERASQLRRMGQTSRAALADVRVWKNERGIGGPLFAEAGEMKLCVGILAYPNGKTEESAGALISRMNLPLKDRIRITVFTDNHTSVKDVLDVEKIPEPSFMRGSVPEAALKIYNYSYVLQSLAQQKCQYGLVLEDAIASRGWADQVLNIVEDSGDDPPWVVMRLMSEYGLVKFTIWRPNELLFLLSCSIVLFLLAWAIVVAIVYALWSAKLAIDEVVTDFARPSIPTVVILILSFYIGLTLLGRPNFLPFGRGVSPVDTGRLAVANLYPRKRMADYSLLLDSVYQTSVSRNSLSMIKPHDTYYPRLVSDLQRQQGIKFTIAAFTPSLFQSIARPELSQLDELKMSHDFPDGNMDTTFKEFEFCDINSRPLIIGPS